MKDFGNISKQAEYGLIEQNDLVKLLHVVSEIQPKVIVEIGVRQGFSFRAFVKAFDPEIAIGIDILNKEEIPAHDMIPLMPSCHYLWGCSSYDIQTVDKVKNILQKRKIDFLFIDGDHSLEGVTKDWELYKELMSANGIVAFHDILTVIQSNELVEVKFLWDRLKDQYKSLVINETAKDEEKLAFSSGIGLLFM